MTRRFTWPVRLVRHRVALDEPATCGSVFRTPTKGRQVEVAGPEDPRPFFRHMHHPELISVQRAFLGYLC